VNASFNTNSIIFIYDRYGKLITKINTNSDGWDGTFNGNPLPSDDYWYTAKLQDGKGHFSLKDDDIFKYNTLIILLPCSYFEIPYI
jgi:gliding motility-associated-like protein